MRRRGESPPGGSGSRDLRGEAVGGWVVGSRARRGARGRVGGDDDARRAARKKLRATGGSSRGFYRQIGFTTRPLEKNVITRIVSVRLVRKLTSYAVARARGVMLV